MKTKSLVTAIGFSVMLMGCTTAPVRDDSRVQNAIGMAGAGAPRLPASGEPYLDDAWFAEQLTVERAVQASLINNAHVRATLTSLDATQAELIQAGLLRNPIGSFMVLRPESGGRFELDYSLMQSLFDLFTRSKRIEIATAAQARVQAEVIMQLVRMAQDTEAAYFETITTRDAVLLQKELLALEQNILTLQTRLARQGTVLNSVVLGQQSIVSQQTLMLRTAQAEHVNTLFVLAQQMGLSTSKPILLPAHLPTLDLPVLNEPELQVLAQKYRAEWQANTAALAQSRAERKLQTSLLRNTEPSLGLAGIRESSGFSLNGLSAQITLPIFDTGRSRRVLADTKIAHDQYELEFTRRLITLEVEQALANLIISNQALVQAKLQWRQQQQLEQLAITNYQQGNNDYISMIGAKRLRLASQIEQLQAQQMQRTSYVDLQRATGVAIQSMSIVTEKNP